MLAPDTHPIPAPAGDAAPGGNHRAVSPETSPAALHPHAAAGAFRRGRHISFEARDALAAMWRQRVPMIGMIRASGLAYDTVRRVLGDARAAGTLGRRA